MQPLVLYVREASPSSSSSIAKGQGQSPFWPFAQVSLRSTKKEKGLKPFFTSGRDIAAVVDVVVVGLKKIKKQEYDPR